MRRAAPKIVPLERAAAVVATWRERGERVVLAHGVFDLLHAGHVRSLSAARARGSRLVVAVYGDSVATTLEGAGRPVLAATDRAALVAALRPVDLVVIFEAASVETLIAALRPDADAPESDEPMAPGSEGAAAVAPDEDAATPAVPRPRATDALIERVRARHKKDA